MLSNRKKYDRTLLLSLVFIVFLLSLTACNEQPLPSRLETEARPARTLTPTLETDSSAPTSTPRPRPSVTPTAPVSELDIESGDLQGVRVIFWHPWTGELARAVEEIAAAYNAANPWGISIEPGFGGTPDQLSNRVASALEAEEGVPDLVAAFLYQRAGWGSDDVVDDLQAYVLDPVWGLASDEQEAFYPAFWQEFGPGVPALRSGEALYYNTTWAQELGFSAAPASPQEFREQACMAAQANLQDENPDNDGTGGYIVSLDYPAALGWLNAFGSPIVSANGERYDFDTAQTQDAFDFLRELFDDGCAWLPAGETTGADFAARRGLFRAGSLTNAGDQAELMQANGSQDEWTLIPFPSPDGEPVVLVQGPSYLVLAEEPVQRMAAWLFIRDLLSPENQARFVQASGSFPLREDALDHLQSYRTENPHWSAGVDLLSYARTEPSFPSWRVVRWVLADASVQLFRYYFTGNQIPEMLDLLNDTANDLHPGLPAEAEP